MLKTKRAFGSEAEGSRKRNRRHPFSKKENELHVGDTLDLLTVALEALSIDTNVVAATFKSVVRFSRYESQYLV